MKGKSVGGGGGEIWDYILVEDQKTSGTQGGTFTAGSWVTRNLNTIVHDDAGHVSVASNQMTLASGTYRFKISAPAYRVNVHKPRLQNITDAATIRLGTSEFSVSGVSTDQTRTFIVGEFTIADTKVLELQHQCSITRISSGLGQPSNLGTEIYSVVELWRKR